MKAASARSHGSRYGIMRSPKILKLRGLKYWDMGYATLFTRESWAAFVSRTVLCNSWGARGTADLKIHTPTSPSPPISLSPPFWNGNAFTLRRHSAVARNVFDAVTYFLSAVECHDREGLGKRRTPLTSSNSCNADHFFKMAVDSASVVWSVVKLVWSAQLFSCLLAMVLRLSSYLLSFISFSKSCPE